MISLNMNLLPFEPEELSLLSDRPMLTEKTAITDLTDFYDLISETVVTDPTLTDAASMNASELETVTGDFNLTNNQILESILEDKSQDDQEQGFINLLAQLQLPIQAFQPEAIAIPTPISTHDFLDLNMPNVMNDNSENPTLPIQGNRESIALSSSEQPIVQNMSLDQMLKSTNDVLNITPALIESSEPLELTLPLLNLDESAKSLETVQKTELTSMNPQLSLTDAIKARQSEKPMEFNPILQSEVAEFAEGSAVQWGAQALKRDTIALNNTEFAVSDSTAKSGMFTPTMLVTPERATTNDVQQPVFKIETPVGDAGWREALSEKITVMTHANMKEASIDLHPKELGPIQISLLVEQNRATVSFSCHQNEVRDLLNQSMPQLKHLFEQSGLQFSGSTVSDQRQHESRPFVDEQPGQYREPLELESPVSSQIRQPSRQHGVDLYA